MAATAGTSAGKLTEAGGVTTEAVRCTAGADAGGMVAVATGAAEALTGCDGVWAAVPPETGGVVGSAEVADRWGVQRSSLCTPAATAGFGC